MKISIFDTKSWIEMWEAQNVSEFKENKVQTFLIELITLLCAFLIIKT